MPVLLRTHGGVPDFFTTPLRRTSTCRSLRHILRRDGGERPRGGARLYLPAVQPAPLRLLRLIQRFAMSDPFAGLCGSRGERIPVFAGQLADRDYGLLTDPEAQVEGSGKLAEPVSMTPACCARSMPPSPLPMPSQPATLMGQTPLSPAASSATSRPFYRVPGPTPPPVAAEFQAINAATALPAQFRLPGAPTASPAASRST